MQRIAWSEGVCVCAYVRPSATPSVQPGGSAPIAAIAALPHKENEPHRTLAGWPCCQVASSLLSLTPDESGVEGESAVPETADSRASIPPLGYDRWRRFVSPRSARRALALVYVDGGVCEIAAALGREQRPWAASHQRRGLRSADA